MDSFDFFSTNNPNLLDSQGILESSDFNSLINPTNNNPGFGASLTSSNEELLTAPSRIPRINNAGVKLDGTSNNDNLQGGAGDDTILGFNSQDTLSGGAGDDFLDGGDGDDKLFGQEGNDALLGGGGQDQLTGGTGNDLLNGGQGDNTLTGGANKDAFALSLPGKNRITDFEDGVDVFTLEGGLTFDRLRIFEQNGETWITTLNNQPLAFLTGVRANLITQDDFLGLPIDPETGFEYNPGELLVKFGLGVTDETVQSVAQAKGAIEVEDLVPSNTSVGQWRVLKFSPETDLLTVRRDLEADPNVEIAGLDYKLSLDATPNDSRFNEQWGLNNTGQDGGTADADIDAPQAWNIQRGDRSVIVAVTDTGVDYRHPDLAANIFTNSGEVPNNGIDDDRNGYVDDVRGYDFGDGDSDPADDSVTESGHGTHVAGIIGAVGNNNRGVAGVSQNVSLLPLKIFDEDGNIFLKYAARGIDYATSMGARVINASWSFSGGFLRDTVQEVAEFFGRDSSFATVTDTIRRANDSQVLFVAAAGNDGKNVNTNAVFPANLNLPNVITVAATDRNDDLASFSNFGSRTVDLGAPGVDILSTLPGNSFGLKSGTSMAAPHVAGAAALLLSEFPSLTAAELRNTLMDNTDPLSSLDGKTVSGGRLNVNKALLALNPEQRVLLTIHQVKQIDNLEEGGDPDFLARVEIDGEKFKTKDIEGSTINPNWRFFKTVTDSTIPIKIGIFEADSLFRGDDDHLDINPRRRAKDLHLTFDVLTGEVIDSDTGDRYFPESNGQFKIRGAFDSDRGEIIFSVSV